MGSKFYILPFKDAQTALLVVIAVDALRVRGFGSRAEPISEGVERDAADLFGREELVGVKRSGAG